MKLTPKVKNAIKLLLEVNPDLIIGGSFSLKYFGLLDREIGDLDIFVDKSKNFSTVKFASISDTLETSDFSSDFAGEDIKRTAFIVDNIKVCCFQMQTQYLGSVKVNIDGLDLKLQNPCYAIAAKATYQSRAKKHKIDLEEIFIKLNKNRNNEN